jgi:hypothetical protein
MKKLILGITVALVGCSSGTSGTTTGTGSGSSSGGSSSGGPCATYLGAGAQQAANYSACYVDAGIDAGPAPTLAGCELILYDAGVCTTADQAALAVVATQYVGCVTGAGTCSADDAGAYLTLFDTCYGQVITSITNGDAGVSGVCFGAISKGL